MFCSFAFDWNKAPNGANLKKKISDTHLGRVISQFQQTYFWKWHVSPKRDLNLGPLIESLLEFETDDLSHSATMAG